MSAKEKKNPQEIIQQIRENGSSKELITELWLACKGFIHQQAFKYIQRHDLDLNLLDDMLQDSYFEFLSAIEHYDPQRGGNFLTLLKFYLPNSFHVSAYGKRSKNGVTCQDRFEMDARKTSLDEPIVEDSEEECRTLLDEIEDPKQEEAFSGIDDKLFQEQLTGAMDRFLKSSLTPRREEVIRQLFYEQKKQREAAADLGITVFDIQSLQKRSIKKLRKELKETDEGKAVLAMCDDLAWRHFGTAAINSGKRETEENALARISKIEKFFE